jgi:hypothetical protein
VECKNTGALVSPTLTAPAIDRVSLGYAQRGRVVLRCWHGTTRAILFSDLNA